MNYYIALVDPTTNRLCLADHAHAIRGGTYALGKSTRCELNVTYNYAKHFVRVLPPNGIRTIYGMTGAQSIPVLMTAIDLLGTDVHEDYWQPTEGNARKALEDVLALATMRPDGVWEGD